MSSMAQQIMEAANRLGSTGSFERSAGYSHVEMQANFFRHGAADEKWVPIFLGSLREDAQNRSMFTEEEGEGILELVGKIEELARLRSIAL